MSSILVSWKIFCDLVCFRFAVAESDCNLAIALDNKYFKAFSRRGAARFALKKYESALEGNFCNRRCSSVWLEWADMWLWMNMSLNRLWDRSETRPGQHRGSEWSEENQRSEGAVNILSFLKHYFKLSLFWLFRCLDLRRLQSQMKPLSQRKRPKWTLSSKDKWRSSRRNRRQRYTKTE